MKRTRITGATERELSHGIGYRNAPPLFGWHEDPIAMRFTEARRGAARMRAQAFHDRIFAPDWTSDQCHPGEVQPRADGDVHPGDPTYVAAWWEERVHGCPAWGKEA